MSNLEQYRTINNSFKRKLVFNLGAEAGFYSEFNNMVFAILYCLKHGYRFVLYSANANFATEKGWEDFFKPFCPTTNQFYHRFLNGRQKPPNLSRPERLFLKAFRLTHPNTHFTYELWNEFYNPAFEKERFDIPALGIRGSLREASYQVVKMIYQFNNTVQTEITEMIGQLNLPPAYTALNIRRGDKDTEFSFVPLEAYIEKLKSMTAVSEVFVFTDDYSVIEEIQEKYPNLKLYTFSRPEERGYVHDKFKTLDTATKRKNLLRMFASIEVMSGAQAAVGTYTTNPGFFLGMRMPKDKFLSVQKSSWYWFERDDVIQQMNYTV